MATPLAHLLVVPKRLDVNLLHEELVAEHCLLVADLWVFLVCRQSPDLLLLRATDDVDLDAEQVTSSRVFSSWLNLRKTQAHIPPDSHVLLDNSPVSRCNGINDLFVVSPDTVPLGQHGGRRGALGRDVALQSLKGHTTRSDT
jgi:hypothetical protein